MPRGKTPAPSPLQVDIANRVIALIKDGTFAAGQHLTEKKLAEQFGVSRSPVRTALRLLEDRGYVELRQRLGVFVSKRAPERMATLARRHLTEEDLYRTIISDRANQVLADTIAETELLARYETTRGQLMKTLLRMAHEGLMERRKGNGWSFLPMLDSGEAKQDSYRFRMILECAALREPGFTVEHDELARSRAQHERFLELRPTAASVPEFFEMNTRFHEMLARFSGNRFILGAIRQQNQLRRFEEYATYVRRRAFQPTESCQEHLQIIKALESDDREWAAALLYNHLYRASKA
jgi:DNA-binding GntR family transcriptional regulator